jgi:Universal stress protein family
LEDETMNTPRITVGLDHTPAGAAAMRYALALAAAREDPEVVAVHAFELSTRPECRLEPDMDEVRRDLRGRCQRWIDDATTGMHPGVRIRLVIADGHPGAVLARAAQGADTLVVGSSAGVRTPQSQDLLLHLCAHVSSDLVEVDEKGIARHVLGDLTRRTQQFPQLV